MKFQSNQQGVKRSSGKRRGKGCAAFLLILLILAGAAYYGVRTIQKNIDGETGDGSKIVVDVPVGAGADTISNLLEENGAVKSAFLFRNYLRFLHDKTPQFMYGKHEIRTDMSYKEMVTALESPIESERETFRIVFPEGWTVLRMALEFEKIGFCSMDEFLDVCNNDSFTVSFFDEIRDDAHKFVKLEGFLYPDTYEFYTDATPHEVVQKMLENFQKKVLDDPEIAKLLRESNLPLEDVVILASVIEKESGDLNEIYKVSSVFHNRLSPDSPLHKLQSCATQSYTIGVLNYYYEDLKGGVTPDEMDYLYDTYRSEGLMVGAICNPGRVSIKATLMPEDTPYYYFLMDNTGKTYYGITFAEHDRNVAAMRSVNATMAGGIG